MAAYEYVLFHESWTMESVAEAVGVSVAGVGALLDELVTEGLIRSSQESPREFVPVAPVVGLRSAVDTVEADLNSHIAEVKELRATTTALMERFEQHRTHELRDRFEVLRGRDATVRRISELSRETRKEICTVVSNLPSEQALEQARAGDRELFERGVSVRALFLEGHRRQSAGLRGYLDWMGTHGGQIRIASILPSRLMCFDRHTALVALEPDNTAAGAIVVRSPGLVDVVATLFEQLWSNAAQADGPQVARPDVSEIEVAVLKLLASGLKDEAVSRRTGLSLRSVRRLIARLSDRLDAHSRFELGVRARDLDLV
jgi:sugar-specific transcriptional regulator TrmB/DNA-binding CsgD family transcriptional regulator